MYFARLFARADAACARGMYVAVMLFDGDSIGIVPGSNNPVENAWFGHPYNVDNNASSVDGDPPTPVRTGQGLRLLTVGDPNLAVVNSLQDAYVRKVIDTVNCLDNIIYEIINEPPIDNTDPAHGSNPWERHIIQLIRGYEATKPKQHPILRSVFVTNGPQSNGYLFVDVAGSPDPNPNAVSPGPGVPCTVNDPGEDYAGSTCGPKAQPSDTNRVILSDSDHLWGLTRIPTPTTDKPVDWVWKSLTRGIGGVLFVDPDVVPSPCVPTNQGNCPIIAGSTSAYNPIRKAMGNARTFATRIDLINMTPQGCASTGYCLAEAGKQFLAYAPTAPNNGTITLTLIGATPADSFDVTWFDPVNRVYQPGGTVSPQNDGTAQLMVPTGWSKAVACLAKSLASFTCPTSNNLRPRR
jgi:hypothetical protein